MPGGLGEFIQAHSVLEPRHASVVAAIITASSAMEGRLQVHLLQREREKTKGRPLRGVLNLRRVAIDSLRQLGDRVMSHANLTVDHKVVRDGQFVHECSTEQRKP